MSNSATAIMESYSGEAFCNPGNIRGKTLSTFLRGMWEAQIQLLNMHIPTMTITERRRAELVKAGLYRGQIVNS